MKLSAWLKTLKHVDKITEIGISEALTCDSEKISLNGNLLKNASVDALKILAKVKEEPWLVKLDLFLSAEMLGKGPKVFKPTYEQLIALEQMRLNVEFDEFNVPFHLTVFELPEEYTRDKIVNGHRPEFVQLYVPPNKSIAITNVMFVGPDSYGMKSWLKNTGESLEEWASFKYEDTPIERPSEWMSKSTEEERTVEMKIRRAILNYCLLLDEVGFKKCGPEAPNEYAQLVKWCQKSNKHTLTNKRNLQAQPIVYGLERNPVQLIRVIGQHDKLTKEECERFKTPHGRRGHWRHYRNDDGSLKFRTRIPPCIVNKHLLMGPISGSYET